MARQWGLDPRGPYLREVPSSQLFTDSYFIISFVVEYDANFNTFTVLKCVQVICITRSNKSKEAWDRSAPEPSKVLVGPARVDPFTRMRFPSPKAVDGNARTAIFCDYRCVRLQRIYLLRFCIHYNFLTIVMRRSAQSYTVLLSSVQKLYIYIYDERKWLTEIM